MDKLPPQSIVDKKYRVLGVLGIGGMGIVYRVEQLNLQVERALKTIFAEEMTDEIWQRFEQEARSISRLDHGNLIKVFDFGLLEKRTPYYVMEIVHGKTLGERIRNQGPLDFDQVLAVFIPTAFALDYVHSKNIVHRDIKPANIMFSEEDNKISAVKVLDFGIAKMVNEAGHSAGLTKPGEVIGSPNFMSPEQSSGEKIDHRSDIYSLGCTLFEALCGRPPFSAKSHVETIMLHQTAEPPTLSQMLPPEKIVDGLDNVMQVMLEKLPENRYQSMEEFAQDLLSLQQGRKPHYARRRISEKEQNKSGLASAAASRSKAEKADHDIDDEEDDENNDTNGGNDTTLSVANPPFLKYKNALLMALALVLLAGLALAVSLVMPPQSAINNTAMQTRQKKHENLVNEAEFHQSKPFSRDPDALTSDNNTIAFKFPDTFSLGKISTLDYSRQAEARGLVLMPAGQMFRFRASETCLRHPEMLRRFLPNEIAALDFSSTACSDEDLACSTHLNKVLYLDISESDLSDKSLAYLNCFSQLKELVISASNIKDNTLAKLKRLRQLESLEAREMPLVKETIKAIAGSTALRKLCVSSSSLNDDDLRQIARDKNVSYLSISGNPGTTARGLQALTSLQKLNHLSLLQNAVSADAIPALVSFPQMHDLKISVKDWTEKNKNDLQRGLPKTCTCALGKLESKETSKSLDDLTKLGL